MVRDTKTGKLFKSLYPSFIALEYSKPSEYVKACWDIYSRLQEANGNLNGKVFKYILAVLCVREGIPQLYVSAKVASVPNVIYDLMFYTAENGPIFWGVKISLRGRYKRADLESIALKYVYRRALSYLITLEKKEAKIVKEKIKSGDVIGLDDVIVATEPEFDKLIHELKLFTFAEPPTVQVITSTQVVTAEKVSTYSSGIQK